MEADEETTGPESSKLNGTLEKILDELAHIRARLSAVDEAVRNLDFNVRAVQHAYQETSAQVRLVQHRCENREQLIKDFLLALECSGPPRRETPSRDLPAIQILAPKDSSSSDE